MFDFIKKMFMDDKGNFKWLSIIGGVAGAFLLGPLIAPVLGGNAIIGGVAGAVAGLFAGNLASGMFSSSASTETETPAGGNVRSPASGEQQANLRSPHTPRGSGASPGMDRG